ncbi:Heat shock protein, Metallo peptidase, MEROPS family M48B [Magnetococcus marinus MC-1]|uniref:Protease HtpX homolog n=1 Tax=Magnetococcus marinus (strain ATCC BAA-1437 / JCM 17883 / MC-1) TaxID=156889 RepID=A0LCG3_MAGMM|nr:protease HtpX [Magnetococcus marinus]ABK45656.1 Heat shock protein, Metallo peptidase, MEROPS family M48B [Magnetococcus marinus MC-1]
MKRIVLFLITNLAIMAVLMVVLNVIFSLFGLNHGSIGGIVVLALVFGMGGSFISLFMSKWLAKRSTGAVVIERPQDATEQWLLETVRRQSQQAGIGMPEVAIFESAEVNAFATGASRNNALVAVSTGLLHGMRKEEAEAVLAHEVSHIANGDMVTLALIQGVLNTFVILLARLIAGAVDSVLSSQSDEEEEQVSGGEGGGMAYFVTSLLAEIVLGVLASVVVMWFSRKREFRADAGGAKLAGREAMIAALERLQKSPVESHLPAETAAFAIAGKRGGLMALFATHHPLEERIEALRHARS